jgi:hypothetical protein
MSRQLVSRGEEIDFELRQLRRLENQLTDQPNLREDIRAVIAKLEAEKASLPPDEK